MQIGAFEATKCEKPAMSSVLLRVRQIQTDLGPMEFFADPDSEQLYMRVWLNNAGQNAIIWYRLEKDEDA